MWLVKLMIRLTHDTKEEWFNWRKAGIGSSDAAAIMGVSPWESAFELWGKKTDRIPPKPSNPAMRRGLDLEPLARQEYQHMTGIAMPAAYALHDTHDFIRASFDGLNEKKKRVAEFKCPGRVDHLTAQRGQIPKHYLWQCVHLLMVSGYDHLDYFSFDGEKGVIVSMERDLKLEKKLIKAEKEFWKYVQKDTPPPKIENTPIDKHGIFKLRRSR